MTAWEELGNVLKTSHPTRQRLLNALVNPAIARTDPDDRPTDRLAQISKDHRETTFIYSSAYLLPSIQSFNAIAFHATVDTKQDINKDYTHPRIMSSLGF